MGFDESSKVWKNGELIPWNQATLHVASHVVHYGSSVFEGIRCYKVKNGSAIFRLTDHLKRLLASAKIYRMPVPYSLAELAEACKWVIRANGYDEAYIRPVIYRGYGALGVDPTPCPVDTVILTWKWGAYLGPEALEKGVDVCTATWHRNAPNTMPTLAKAGGNYLNSQLIKLEAKTNGYDEGIALTSEGLLSEGSGENLFIVYKNKLWTTPLCASILPGITRDTVFHIAKDLGIEIVEQSLPRELLYIADEAFFTGTAAEITPIRSVDRIPIGEGKRGKVTQAIQTRFYEILSGKVKDEYGWLEPV